jgi:NAD+ synthase
MINPMNVDLNINTDVARQILTSFIKSEVRRVGFTRAVINLSGGLDSALSCALVAEALGPENVLALRLPYRTSSKDSLEHAQLMIDQFGVQSKTIDISGSVDPLIEQDHEMSNTRKGNIMARTRMIAL